MTLASEAFNYKHSEFWVHYLKTTEIIERTVSPFLQRQLFSAQIFRIVKIEVFQIYLLEYRFYLLNSVRGHVWKYNDHALETSPAEVFSSYLRLREISFTSILGDTNTGLFLSCFVNCDIFSCFVDCDIFSCFIDCNIFSCFVDCGIFSRHFSSGYISYALRLHRRINLHLLHLLVDELKLTGFIERTNWVGKID